MAVQVIAKLEEVALPFGSKDEMSRHLIHDKKVTFTFLLFIHKSFLYFSL